MDVGRSSIDKDILITCSEKSSIDTDSPLMGAESGLAVSKIQWLLPTKSGQSGTHCSRLLFSRFRWLLLSASLLLITFIFYALSDQPGTLVEIVTGQAGYGLSPVYNSTLGFQKVFAIGLRGRTDRRDALTVAASLSQIQIDWSDGVAFEDIPTKAIPEAFTDADARPSVIASWRAHLNALSRIVSENIQTALILEDDSDWDWNIKGQLDQFATGVRQLQRTPLNEAMRASPYGSAWDTLWIGNCRIRPSNATQDFYFITNDSTVPPLTYRRSIFNSPHILPEVFTNDTRIVLRAAKAGCTFGYAITWEAARKVLTSLSLGGKGVIFDNALADMCKGMHITPYNCYGIYPPLISSHRFAGSANRDSDIRNKKEHYHPEFSWDIVYSVLQNARRLLTGATDVVSQWPKETVPNRALGHKYGDEVAGELRTVELGKIKEQHLKGINEPHERGSVYWEDDLDRDGSASRKRPRKAPDRLSDR